MGVIIHTGQDKMSMADVRQMWERLLKVPLDALGLPAPAGACSRQVCPSTMGVCPGVWAHWRGLGRACVGMHGCGPTSGLKMASTAACLYSCDGLGCAKHRLL